MQRSCTFTPSETSEYPWHTCQSRLEIPEEYREEVCSRMGIDYPSPWPHFFIKTPSGYTHTSELLPVTPGNPLYGSGYMYYSKGDPVLAVSSMGHYVKGTFTYSNSGGDDAA